MLCIVSCILGILLCSKETPIGVSGSGSIFVHSQAFLCGKKHVNYHYHFITIPIFRAT